MVQITSCVTRKFFFQELLRARFPTRVLATLLNCFGLAVVFLVGNAMAGVRVELQHTKTNEKLYCSLPDDVLAKNLDLAHATLEWCFKACEIHGIRESSSSHFNVSDFSVDPVLSAADTQLAKEITPPACLPYEPISLVAKSKGNVCLRWGVTEKIYGLLVEYSGEGHRLAVKFPQLRCNVADALAPKRRPKSDNLWGIYLAVPEKDKGKFMKFVGRQVVVTGSLSKFVQNDYSELQLKDVKLMND